WIEVATNLWIKPHKPEWTRKGYRIRFAVRDFRGPRSSSVRGKTTRESLDGVTTLVPFARFTGAPERVDQTTERRITRQAREREQERRAKEHAELLSAMAELRAAIDSMPPDRKRRMSRTLWTLRSRLDSAERELRRRDAA